MKNLVLLVVCCQFLFVNVAVGQKNEEAGGNSRLGIFNSKREYAEFMGSAKRIAYGPNGTPELKEMVSMINDVVLNRPIGSTAGQHKSQASSIGMLADKNIRSELEMVDSQYQELQQMNNKIRQRMVKEIRELDFSKTETATTQLRGIRDRARKELDSVLLPHQLKRLQQLHLQSQMKRRSLVDVITSDPLKAEIDLDEKQATLLRKEEEKIEKELQVEIEKLRAKARE
ncbi:MAG: hypothetical protein VX438_16555, partial [Planctomycetota bacterium]|nr:hypothetical protein [Planctomycetota bacterium]